MGGGKEPSTYTSSNSTQLCAIKNQDEILGKWCIIKNIKNFNGKIKGILNSNYVTKTNKESTTEEQILVSCH